MQSADFSLFHNMNIIKINLIKRNSTRIVIGLLSYRKFPECGIDNFSSKETNFEPEKLFEKFNLAFWWFLFSFIIIYKNCWFKTLYLS